MKRLLLIAGMLSCGVVAAGETYNGYDLPPDWEQPVMDAEIHSFTELKKFEFRTGEAAHALVMDAQGWIGGDHHRFWWKAEGEQEIRSPKAGEFELQAMYGKLISAFWDATAGIRLDRVYSGTNRRTDSYLTIGLEGTAPYWFEVEPTLLIGKHGDVRLEIELEYELLLTQRMILEPRMDLLASAQANIEHGEKAGLNELELGIRLRYDITRQFSPYVGLTWSRALGATSGLRRAQGQDISVVAFVIGVRTWF